MRNVVSRGISKENLPRSCRIEFSLIKHLNWIISHHLLLCKIFSLCYKVFQNFPEFKRLKHKINSVQVCTALQQKICCRLEKPHEHLMPQNFYSWSFATGKTESIKINLITGILISNFMFHLKNWKTLSWKIRRTKLYIMDKVNCLKLTARTFS